MSATKSRSTKKLGYIVLWEGRPTWEARSAEVRGVLFFHHLGTVFPNRRMAHRAIARSREYATAKAMPWSDAYTILPLVPR